MMASNTIAVLEARADATVDVWNPLAGPEWTMPAGWLTLLVAVCVGACVVAGLAA